MAPRLFTLDEANALLPTVRALVKTMLDARRQVLDMQPGLWPLVAKAIGNGGGRSLSQAAQQILKIQESLVSLNDLGLEVKDINSGLVDFPARYQGRIVLLCWQWDEPAVLFWHERDAGFAGRKPIEDFH